jgi:hypothetical protein
VRHSGYVRIPAGLLKGAHEKALSRAHLKARGAHL